MLRAVPSTMFRACSISRAFKSAIFVRQISSTWATVTLPTFSLLGTPEPLAIPAAFFNKRGGGRAFGDELEGPVVVNFYHYGNGHAAGVLGPLVELLYELAQVDAETAQRGAYRRGRRGLTARDLKLHFTD